MDRRFFEIAILTRMLLDARSRVDGFSVCRGITAGRNNETRAENADHRWSSD